MKLKIVSDGTVEGSKVVDEANEAEKVVRVKSVAYSFSKADDDILSSITMEFMNLTIDATAKAVVEENGETTNRMVKVFSDISTSPPKIVVTDLDSDKVLDYKSVQLQFGLEELGAKVVL